jgi:O-antigen ligase
MSRTVGGIGARSRPGWLRSGALPPDVRTTVGVVAVTVALLAFIKPAGPANIAPVDPLIAASILAVLLWVGWTERSLRVPYALPVGLMMAGGAIAALNGPKPGSGLLALVQDLFMLAWCMAVANVATVPAALDVLMRAWALSSIGWAGLLIVAVTTGENALAGFTTRLGPRASLTFGDPNVAATFFLIGLMVVLASRYPRQPATRLAGCLVLLVALALTGSNGGLIESLVGLAILFAVEVNRRAGLAAALAVSCLLAASALPLSLLVRPDRIGRWAVETGRPLLVNSIGRSTQSSGERMVLLKESLDLLRQSGPLGSGPASTAPLLAARGYPYVEEAHNDYVATLVERGLIGAVGLLLLIGEAALRAGSLVTRPLADELAKVVPRPAALLAAIAGVGIAGAFYEVLHFRHVWLLLGVIAALYYQRPP